MKKEILTLVYEDRTVSGVSVWDAHFPQAVFIPVERLVELRDKLNDAIREAYGPEQDE